MISVLMATYNGEKFIEKQLESISNQSFSDFEVVVVDDFSTDKTVEFIERFFERNDFRNYRIFINDKNLGHNKSFETGIRYCRGDYIALCDQDDVWTDDKLQILYKSATKSGCDLIYSQSYLLMNDKISNKLYPRQNNSSDLFIRLQYNNARGASMFVKRKFLENMLPFSDADIYDKWIYYISFITGKIEFINKPLDFYRSHSHNVVGTRFRYRNKTELISKHKLRIKFYEDMLSYFTNKYINSQILSEIKKIISFYAELNSCLQKKGVRCLNTYISFILKKEYFFKEKLIYLYYILFK